MNHQVRLLFHELADLSPCERDQVFRERQIAAELRAEVESLLGFDSTNHRYLTDRVSNAAEEMLRSANAHELDYCGRYHLVRLLGSGGMGAVYLAERTDGEIQQQVAVKLLRTDAHRPAWRDRFLKERQILASLHHPSIVHVIDAGHTDEGRPYLVMEYVEGTPIDLYAERIELRDRLELFLRVCGGVSHAHHHLIIHRDLKPSNILVDSAGQPKLLDFGIAKLLDEMADATQTVERLLTPNYASPEQLRGNQQTTATDIYSLGAVLYKLLTARSPYESDTHTPQALGAIAGTRAMLPPTRLNPNLPTDIDYILQKALRNEPDDRYTSVEALAADIRALLESRPVQARSGNAWYRTRKFLWHYWVPVAAAALVIASLSAGLYMANHERVIAQRRFLEVRQLANKLFDIDAQVRQLPGGSKTRQLIVDTSLEYLRRLAAEVRADPELALELGTAYMRVGRVQGVPISSNLGQIDRAEGSLRTAEMLIRSVVVAQHGNRTAFLRMAQIANDRMMLAEMRRPDDEALVLARQSIGWLDKYLDNGNVDPSAGDQALLVLDHVATRYRVKEQFEEALRLYHRGIDIARTVNRPLNAGALLMGTALIHRARGELEEALRDIRESAKILEPAPGTSDLELGRSMNFVAALTREGMILGEDDGISLGRSQEALVCLQRAFDTVEGFASKDPADSNSRKTLAWTATTLADILRHSDPGRSITIYDLTLRRLAEVKNNSKFRRDEVKALAGSTYPLRRLGRHNDAKQRLQAAFSRLRQLKLYPAEQIELGSETDEALRALADDEAANSKARRAAEIYRELLQRVFAAKPKPETSLADAVDLSNIYRGAAASHRRALQTDLASEFAARRLELWQHWDRRLPNNPFVRRQIEVARLP